MTYHRELIKTNGVILHVVQAGPGDGKLVVLLHGFPEFWYGWRHQIDALAAQGYRVIVPDQRGYNASDKPPRVLDYSVDKLAADINGLVRHFGRDTAHIVGHDWGGIVAWWLALTNPRRISKLAIMNAPHPVVFNRYLRTHLQQVFKSWYAGVFQIPALPENIMKLGDYGFAAQVLRNSGKPDTFSDEEIEQYRAAWRKIGAMRSMINWYRAAVQHLPQMPEDPRVHMPTLMIWGAGDPFLSRELAPESIAMCEQGRLMMIEDATHWVQHDASQQVNELLLEFFAE